MRPGAVAALSLVATWLFFLEYLPPFARVRIPYDLEGFHYPLLNYAFQTLRSGQFPEWDPSIYCGLSLAGNPQAGLFYPPNWLLLGASAGRWGLAYQGLEALIFAHLWLAFLLSFRWLSGRGLHPVAAALGAAVFAYSGYTVSQIQHAGVVCGYTWIPLGLGAIDQAGRRQSWRPLWKLAAASALCLLAGYPPAWFVFAVCVLVYAAFPAGRRWLFPAAVLALAFSLLVGMVQVLPALQTAALKTPENKYGGGIQGASLYASYFLPNYFGTGLEEPNSGEPSGQYFYLGAPGLAGLAWLLSGRRWRAWLPAVAIVAVCLVFLTNPWRSVERLLGLAPILGEICRDWNFLAGLTLAASLVAAVAADDLLRRPPPSAPRWLSPVLALALAGWSVRQLLVWLPGGADFASGWQAGLEPAVMLALFVSVLVWLPNRPRLLALLLLAVAVDYKVFGASRRFNAFVGDADQMFASDARRSRQRQFTGMDDAVYQRLRSDPTYRVAVDPAGPHPTDLRHYGLATPQGFDPMLPAQYKKTVERFVPFRTDRLFDVDPSNEAMLDRLAVRYFLIPAHAPQELLSSNPRFRLLEPSQSFFHVYEYLRAQPAYRFEAAGGSIQPIEWKPGRRRFRVSSTGGGRLVLLEQFDPGWTVLVDERPAPIERWGEAFQAVQASAGEHQVTFQYRAPGLRLGACITAASLALLWWVARKS